MNLQFKRHREKLQECINSDDTEAVHIMADCVLCEIAKDAASGFLTISEVITLVGMYQEVDKWYA